MTQNYQSNYAITGQSSEITDKAIMSNSQDVIALKQRIIELEQELKSIRLQNRNQNLEHNGIHRHHNIQNRDDINNRHLIEQELNLFKHAVESSNDAIAIADPEGKQIYQNAAFCRLFDYATLEEFNENGGIAATFVEQYLFESMTQAVIADNSWEGEVELRSRKGHVVPCYVRSNAIKDNFGNIIALMGSMNDISEMKRAEQKLREQQQFLRSIYDGVEMVIWVVDVSEDGNFFLNGWNIRGEKASGYKGEVVIGKTPEEWLGEVEGKKLRQRYQVCVDGGEAISYEDLFQFEEKIIWFFTTVNPIKNAEGKIYRLIGTSYDISDRKKAEEALQQQVKSSQLLNSLTSQIRNTLDFDVILTTAVEEIRRFLEIDSCAFTWHCPEEDGWETIKHAKVEGIPSYIGRYSAASVGTLTTNLLNLEVIRIDDVNLLEEPIFKQLIKSLGLVASLSIPMQMSSGVIGVLGCSHRTARFWEDDEVSLLQAVMEQLAIALNQAELYKQSQARTLELELTLQELQKTQAQMLQSEKMSSLGQMVAGVAHEINNPVNFIHGNLTHACNYTSDLLRLIELYQISYPEPVESIQEEIELIDLPFIQEDLIKLLNSMKVGTSRIREIVKSLRVFSRLDEAECKTADIHEGIESTLMILQNRTKAKPEHPGIEIIKEYSEIPLVECYAGQLNQVFMNILVNAIDSLEERDKQRSLAEIKQSPSKIWIKTELLANKKAICIQIQDNGQGIPLDVQNRIFDPFFTTKGVGKGTGLGMSISYQIITEKHQGSIKCISTLGEGATFIIQIPLNLS